MAEYFAMGGYAAYIWPAYGVTVVVLIGLLVATLAGLRRRQAMVKALEAVRPTRRNRASIATAPRTDVGDKQRTPGESDSKVARHDS